MSGVPVAEIPAVCETCGTVFGSGLALRLGTRNVGITGGRYGPCPSCGGLGKVADGVYEFIDDARLIFEAWTPNRRQQLLDAIAAARQTPEPRAAVEAAITSDPGLREVAERLLIPKDAAAFWALIVCLLAVLSMLQGGGGTVVNENTTTVISTPTPIVASKPPPRPPPKKKAKRPSRKAHRRH